MKKVKEQKGITLVALVVTIVVLLILVGVTITYVFSDNGILSQAQTATTKTDATTMLEEIQSKLLAIQLANTGSWTYSNDDVKTVVAEVTGLLKDDIDDNADTVTSTNGTTITISSLWVDGTSSGGSSVATISTTTSYVGCYADVDGNGSVDGVIFADLMQSAQYEYWYSSTNGTYSWTVLTDGVKSYYVSQEDYDGAFGTMDVISPVSGTTGEERFYVMALENVDSDYHCWYNGAYGNMTVDTSRDFGKGYANTGTIIDKWNSGEYGTQDSGSYTDMWGLDAVQTEYTNGWFVPSRAEWSAFAAELGITSSNYGNFGLSNYYWSSSQYNSNGAYLANFYSGYMDYYDVDNNNYVRLATTF